MSELLLKNHVSILLFLLSNLAQSQNLISVDLNPNKILTNKPERTLIPSEGDSTFFYWEFLPNEYLSKIKFEKIKLLQAKCDALEFSIYKADNQWFLLSRFGKNFTKKWDFYHYPVKDIDSIQGVFSSGFTYFKNNKTYFQLFDGPLRELPFDKLKGSYNVAENNECKNILIGLNKENIFIAYKPAENIVLNEFFTTSIVAYPNKTNYLNFGDTFNSNDGKLCLIKNNLKFELYDINSKQKFNFQIDSFVQNDCFFAVWNRKEVLYENSKFGIRRFNFNNISKVDFIETYDEFGPEHYLEVTDEKGKNKIPLIK